MLLKVLSYVTGYTARYVNYSATNVHLYDNQIDAAHELLQRPDLNTCELHISTTVSKFHNIQKFDLFEYVIKHLNEFIILKDYKPSPLIKVEMLAYNI